MFLLQVPAFLALQIFRDTKLNFLLHIYLSAFLYHLYLEYWKMKAYSQDSIYSHLNKTNKELNFHYQ